MNISLYRAALVACAFSLVLADGTHASGAESGLRGSVALPPHVAADLARDADELEGMAALGWLLENARDLPGEALEDALRQAVESDHVEVRLRAAQLLMEWLWRTGRTEEVTRLRQEFGVLDQFAVLGPFSNDGMRGFAEPGPLQRGGLDSDGEWEGRRGPIRWTQDVPLSSATRLRVHERIQPADSAWMYVVADVRSPVVAPARIHVSASGAWRLWHNGEFMAERRERYETRLMAEKVDLHLVGGRNRVVFQIAVEDEAPEVAAMLLSPQGERLPGVTVIPVDGALGEPLQAPVEGRAAEGSAARERPLLAEGSAERLVRAAMLVHAEAPEHPESPWEEFSDATSGRGGELSTGSRVELAKLARSSWRRMEMLRAVWEDAPHDAYAVLNFARARTREMGRDGEAEAREALERLRGAEPSEEELLLRLEAALLWRGRFYHAALERLLPSVRAETGSPGLLSQTASYARDLRRDDLLPELYRQHHAMYRDDVAATGDLVDALRVLGDERGIWRRLDELRELRPNDPDVRVLRAEQARVEADFERAHDELEHARLLCPGCDEVYEEIARLRVRSGDVSGAREALLAALELAPQRASLREFAERLSREADIADERVFSEWRLDDDDLIAARDSVGQQEESLTWLADQRFVEVFQNGLSRAWHQRAALVHTRSGAERLRTISLTYSTDAEEITVESLRVIRPDGSVRERWDSRDRALTSGPQAIYYDVRSRTLFVDSLEPGDVIVLEYRLDDVGYRNIFEDYFGDVFFVQGEHERRLVRYGVLMPEGRTLYSNDDTLSHASGERTQRADGRSMHVWEAEHVPAASAERRAPGAAQRFEMLSVSTWGDWDGLADWYWNLIQHQLVSSPEMIERVEELTAAATSTREIVEAIHNYVVRSTRYVGLEFGIHGFRPYRTTDCFERRFGDCKDSASLMKVMLAIAGVHSETVLIRTRDQGRIGEFPPSLHVFNHMVLHVPELDLWLDGTAGHSGVDEMPPMDQLASALIVHDGEGGTFLTTRSEPPEASRSQTVATLDLRGEAPRAEADTTVTGAFAPAYRRAYEGGDRREERFENSLARTYGSLSLIEATFDGLDSLREPVTMQWKIDGGDWVRTTDSGGTIRAVPGMSSRYGDRLLTGSSRSSPLVLDHAWQSEEEWTILLPRHARVVALPTSTEVESAWGRYALDVEQLEGEHALRIRAHFSLDALEVSPEEYDAFRQFVLAVDDVVDQRIELRFEEDRQ